MRERGRRRFARPWGKATFPPYPNNEQLTSFIDPTMRLLFGRVKLCYCANLIRWGREKNMLSIDDYIDAAKDAIATKSDSAIGRALGCNQSLVSAWRLRRAWPSDEIMVSLAKIARADEKEALLFLNWWRSSSRNEVAAATAYKATLDAYMVLFGRRRNHGFLDQRRRETKPEHSAA